MKKMILLICLGLAFGCASVNSFLCKPTAQQTEAATVGETVAQSALVAASTYVGGEAIVTALATVAIPIFKKVVAGYCVLQAEWDTAVNTVATAQTTTKSRALSDPTIAKLKAIKWGK